MRFRRFNTAIVLLLFVGSMTLAACGEAQPTPSNNPEPSPNLPELGTPPPAQAAYCENGGAVTAVQGDPLAASVNGQGIPMSLFEQQANQSEIALVQQGVDPESDDGKEAIKGLRRQVLSQLIDDALVEQAARALNIGVSGNEINNRVQQVINDAGSRQKFDEYLQNNQLTMEDLCQQIRASTFSEVMMANVGQNLPTRVEQVHVAHILFANKEDAEAALQRLNSGEDFAGLAKQISHDEATRDMGGDLGWFPRDVMPPEFEDAAFGLKVGQFSPVVTTQLGMHIIKLLERDPARVLSPELIQNQRLAAFNAWLSDRRAQAKIEMFVQE